MSWLLELIRMLRKGGSVRWPGGVDERRSFRERPDRSDGRAPITMLIRPRIAYRCGMWSPRTKVLLTATITLWIAAYVAWTADWMVTPMPHLLARSLGRIPLCMAGIGLCWLIGAVLDRQRERSWVIRLAIALVMSVVSSMTYAALSALVFSALIPLWGATNFPELLQLAMTIAWVFVAWSALYFAISADADARDARLRLAGARAAEFRARNQALAQQISPHFLFNALNVVSGLILDGTPLKAERVTVALAGLLRRSLESDGRECVPLGEEIDAACRYLEIEEARFEDRFRLIDAVPSELRHLPVPPMILQPLVENAIKHGVARTTRLVTLRIAAAATATSMEISVVDDAEPDPHSAARPGLGIGQSSVHERLELMYGDAAAMECGPDSPRGYRVTIRLPAGSAVHA